MPYNLLMQFLATLPAIAQANVIYETQYQYNDLGQLITLQNSGSNSNTEILSRFSYSYDENGNIIAQTDARRGVSSQLTTYTYDAQSRLNSVYTNSNQENYNFDLASNLRQEVTATATFNRFYNARNELSAIQGSNGTAIFTYDPNGSGALIKGAAGHVYQYNALNELSDFTSKQRSTLYLYDGNGERLSKQNSKVSQTFYSINNHIVNIADWDQSQLTSYLFGNEREAYFQGNQALFYQ